MGCTQSVAVVETCPALKVKKGLEEPADSKAVAAAPSASVEKAASNGTASELSPDTKLGGKAREEDSRVQFKTTEIDEADKVYSVENTSQLILSLGSQQAASVDLAGITVPFPDTSTSDCESWLSKEIWPHQNFASVEDCKANEAVFSLSAHGSSDAEPLICVVPSGAQQLYNGTLELLPNSAIVLDANCSSFCFKDMIVQGGILVCYGEGCNVTFSGCTLHCTVVVTSGARVELKDTQIRLNAENEKMDKGAATGVGIIANAAGTIVNMIGGGIHGCLQAVSVQNGAKFTGGPIRDEADSGNEDEASVQRLVADDFTFSGFEVAGDNSELDLKFTNIKAATTASARYGVHAYSNAKVELSGVFTDNTQYAIEISSSVPATLHRCHVEAASKAGVHLSGGAQATLTECWIRMSAAADNITVRDSQADATAQSDQPIGLLVEGQGTQADVESCIFHPHDLDTSETTVTAVTAKCGGVVEARKSFMQGQVITEDAGELNSTEPVEKLRQSENIPSPALMGSRMAALLACDDWETPNE